MNFCVVLSLNDCANLSPKRGLKERQKQSRFFVHKFLTTLLQVAPCSLLVFLTAPWGLSEGRTILPPGSKRSPRNSPSPCRLRDVLAGSPAEPCCLVLVTEEDLHPCQRCCPCQIRKQKLDTSACLLDKFIFCGIQSYNAKRRHKSSRDHQIGDTAWPRYCLKPWPKANAKGAGQGAEMYVVLLPLTLCPWSNPVAQGFPGHMCWQPAAFVRATALPDIGCAWLLELNPFLLCSIPPLVLPESAERSLQGQQKRAPGRIALVFALPTLLWSGVGSCGVLPSCPRRHGTDSSQGDCRLPVQARVFTANVNSELL